MIDQPVKKQLYILITIYGILLFYTVKRINKFGVRVTAAVNKILKDQPMTVPSYSQSTVAIQTSPQLPPLTQLLLESNVSAISIEGELPNVTEISTQTTRIIL